MPGKRPYGTRSAAAGGRGSRPGCAAVRASPCGRSRCRSSRPPSVGAQARAPRTGVAAQQQHRQPAPRGPRRRFRAGGGGRLQVEGEPRGDGCPAVVGEDGRDRVVGRPLVPADEDVGQGDEREHRAEQRHPRARRAGAAAEAPRVGHRSRAEGEHGRVGGERCEEHLRPHGLVEQIERPARRDRDRGDDQRGRHGDHRQAPATPSPVNLPRAGEYRRQGRAAQTARPRRRSDGDRDRVRQRDGGGCRGGPGCHALAPPDRGEPPQHESGDREDAGRPAHAGAAPGVARHPPILLQEPALAHRPSVQGPQPAPPRRSIGRGPSFN